MSVRLLLSAGRGPRECAWALSNLLSRLEADAVGHHLRTLRVHSVGGEPSGTLQSVIIEVSGEGAEGFAVSWTGTLCWQAPSPYRPGVRRKNWYVTAQPCPMPARVTTFSEADIEVVPCRTGGPGGQHRNKASTAVRATHRPSGTVVVVDTERQASLNRRIAIDLLRERIEAGNVVAEQAALDAQWRIHDHLIRGNPIRTERP